MNRVIAEKFVEGRARDAGEVQLGAAAMLLL
jgi:hypothetical protein